MKCTELNQVVPLHCNEDILVISTDQTSRIVGGLVGGLLTVIGTIIFPIIIIILYRRCKSVSFSHKSKRAGIYYIYVVQDT